MQVGSGGAVPAALMQYARAALDALGWRWGPCHLEIKMRPCIAAGRFLGGPP